MSNKLPITLISQVYNLTLSSEPGFETKMFDQLAPIVDQICVVVQDSLDDTLDIVAQYTKDVVVQKCLFHPEPYRNMLLGMARNEWILFLDPDMYFATDPRESLEPLVRSDAADAWKIGRVNFLAPDRSKPGDVWGAPVPPPHGEFYLFRKSKCIGSPAILHYPFAFQEGSRAAVAREPVIHHRSLHFSTERWKIYYPFVVKRMLEQHRGDDRALEMIGHVMGCHWGNDSSTFARGRVMEDGSPRQAVDISAGVRVLFHGVDDAKQTWPWVTYQKDGMAEIGDSHVVVFGDDRLSYDPRFIERSLEMFAMFPEADAVQSRWLGRPPEGMTREQVCRASMLVLAPFADKLLGGGELNVAIMPRHLARGAMA